MLLGDYNTFYMLLSHLVSYRHQPVRLLFCLLLLFVFVSGFDLQKLEMFSCNSEILCLIVMSPFMTVDSYTCI